MWKVVYIVQILHRESRQMLTITQHPLYFLGETMPWCIYIKLHCRVYNRGKYADGFSNSMIDDKNSYIPSPLIMFTCTTLRHAPLVWQKNNGFHLKASKSKLKADRPEPSKYFNYKNDCGKNASCCATTGCKLLVLLGGADTYTFLMNTWNTLLESYQQRVHNNTLDTIKCQIPQAENPTPAMFISMKAANIDNAILLDYVAS